MTIKQENISLGNNNTKKMNNSLCSFSSFFSNKSFFFYRKKKNQQMRNSSFLFSVLLQIKTNIDLHFFFDQQIRLNGRKFTTCFSRQTWWSFSLKIFEEINSFLIDQIRDEDQSFCTIRWNDNHSHEIISCDLLRLSPSEQPQINATYNINQHGNKRYATLIAFGLIFFFFF